MPKFLNILPVIHLEDLKMFIEDPSLGPQKDDVDVIWGLSSIPFKMRHVWVKLQIFVFVN